jgi:hypothetical protein
MRIGQIAMTAVKKIYSRLSVAGTIPARLRVPVDNL